MSATPDLQAHNVVVPFWEAALGRVSFRLNDQFVYLRTPEDRHAAFDILFQRVPEPKVGKNRVHIDFDAGDMEAEVARLVDLGASVVAKHSLATSAGRSWRSRRQLI